MASKRAKHLRETKVHDMRANRLLALKQGNDPNGGALVSAHTANKVIKAAKKELDDAIVGGERAQALIEAARRKYDDLRLHRYQTLDDRVQMHPETGEFEPFNLPMTSTEYTQRLASEWGPTWATGPTWRLGTVSTTFRCVVVSCISKSDVGDGVHRIHTSAPRDSRIRSFPWTNRYIYSPTGALVWYMDEAGDRHYKDGRLLDRAALPDVSRFDPSEQQHMLNLHMRESFGPDVIHTDPFNPTSLGKVNYRLETLGSEGRVNVTLDFPTAFLSERMHFGGDFGAVAPFLPGLGQWAFLQDARLPISSDPVLQLVRDFYDWKTPTDAFVGEVDEAFLADRLEKFVDHASNSPEDVEFRRLSYCNSRFHAECPELTHIDSSASFALLIEHVVAHDVGPAAPIAPIDTQLGDFIVPQILANRHVRVRANPNATSMIDWFLKPDVRIVILCMSKCELRRLSCA